LELRAPDSCTRIDDAIAIAALYRALARYLYSHPEHNAEIDNVDRAIAVENKWRAQRYGVQGTFVTRSGARTVAETLSRVLDMIEADGEALNCTEQLERCRSITREGTSADEQLRIFTESEHEGADIALHKVSRWVRDATLVA
jgi:carboxylate-amine ligase